MRLFSRKNYEHSISAVHHALVSSFNHVKRDVVHVFSWLNYFHKKHQEHDEKFIKTEERLANIEKQIATMPKTHHDIKEVLDYYYSYEDVIKRIQEINSRLNYIENQKEFDRQDKRIGIRERLVKKITKSSKDYVKSVILSLIKKYSKITGPQLKEILVEEQGLCSKSSFYRLLTELEEEELVKVIHTKKEKIYLTEEEIIK